MSELYKRIQAICESKGMTVSRMCLNIKLPKSMMSDLKAGRKKSFNTETLTKIAEYLDVSVDELLGTEKEKALTETGERVITDEELKFALWGGDAKDVTDEMFEEVKRFAEFVRNRKKE